MCESVTCDYLVLILTLELTLHNIGIVVNSTEIRKVHRKVQNYACKLV